MKNNISSEMKKKIKKEYLDKQNNIESEQKKKINDIYEYYFDNISELISLKKQNKSNEEILEIIKNEKKKHEYKIKKHECKEKKEHEFLFYKKLSIETGLSIDEIIEIKKFEENRLEKAINEKALREKKNIAQKKIRELLLEEKNIDENIFDSIDKCRYIAPQVKKEVFERDNGKCVHCGSQNEIEYDHVLPFSRGGSSSADNIQILCLKCNRKKHNKIF